MSVSNFCYLRPVQFKIGHGLLIEPFRTRSNSGFLIIANENITRAIWRKRTGTAQFAILQFCGEFVVNVLLTRRWGFPLFYEVLNSNPNRIRTQHSWIEMVFWASVLCCLNQVHSWATYLTYTPDIMAPRGLQSTGDKSSVESEWAVPILFTCTLMNI